MKNYFDPNIVQYEQQLKLRSEFQKAVDVLELHVKANDKGILTVSSDRSASHAGSITPTMLKEICAEYDITFDIARQLIASTHVTNDHLASGQLAIANTRSSQQAISLTSTQTTDDTAVTQTQILGNPVCGGQTRVDWKWYGVVIGLDSCDVDGVIAMSSAGGGVAAIIAAAIPVIAPVAGIVAAAVSASAGLMKYLNETFGRGVWITFTWAGVPMIWHQ